MKAPAHTTATLELTGMSCAACVVRIETAMKKVIGVHEAVVNLAARRVLVTFDAGQVPIERLIATVQDVGYGAIIHDSSRYTQHGIEDLEATTLRRHAVIAVVATVPVCILAMTHGLIPGMNGWIGAILQALVTTGVVFGPGVMVLRPALIALRHATADMNTLVSMGVLAAWGYSMVNLGIAAASLMSLHQVPLYFEAAAVIMSFVLIGKVLEVRARARLSDAVAGLVALSPPQARRLQHGQESMVDVDSVRLDDHLLVHPGERFPADGLVVHGTSTVDASLVTGESMPMDIAPASLVRAGTLNQTGAVQISVSAVGVDSALGQIVAAVEQAQGSRAPIARLADRVSGVFIPIVLGIALGTAAIWLMVDSSGAGIARAIEHAVTVLVIACPCALGLATPAAVAVGTGRGAELGVLLKGGAAIEMASRIDTVFLDKTGTLTTGRPSVTDVIMLHGSDEKSVLSLAASAERGSEHPLAQALVRAALERGVNLVLPTEVVALPGKGLRATVTGHHLAIGTMRWIYELGMANAVATAAADRLSEHGRTIVVITVDGQPSAILGLMDTATPEAARAVDALHRLGIRVVMVTGDRAGAASAVARELGIDEIHAEARPEDKARLIAAAQAQGQRVAMVGDGLNDASALAGADLGIAMGTGTEVAQAAAEVVLMHGIAGLPVALDVSRRTLHTIRENLAWAFAYNLLGIPIAAGALEPLTGWSLSPMIASAAMALSSVSVLANSMRLSHVLRFRSPIPPGVQKTSWQALSGR